MEHFVIIVNGWKSLTIITKSPILDVAAALDPPLDMLSRMGRNHVEMDLSTISINLYNLPTAWALKKSINSTKMLLI